MKIKPDVENSTFICAEPPVAVMDVQTGQQKVDRNGEQVFSTKLATLTAGASEMLAVKTPAPPKMAMGDKVAVRGLIGTTWEIEGRSGVSFRADRIELAGASQSSPASSSASTSSPKAPSGATAGAGS